MTKNWITETQEDKTSSWESGEAKGPKLGRPEKPANERRKSRFSVNLTDDEFALIEGVAKALDTPVAVYVRKQALLAAEEFMEENKQL